MGLGGWGELCKCPINFENAPNFIKGKGRHIELIKVSFVQNLWTFNAQILNKYYIFRYKGEI